MAVPYNLLKPFKTWLGLDLRSSDVNRPAEYATEIKNVDYRKTGAMNKRKGYKWYTRNAGGCGITTYLRLNTGTNALEEQLVVIDDNLKVLKTELIDLNYTGTKAAYFSILVRDDAHFWFELYEDNDLILEVDLGQDSNDGTPYTIAELATEINLLTEFSSSIPTNGTELALNVLLVEGQIISVGTPQQLTLNYFEAVDLPTATPSFFTDLIANKDNPEYENPTFANINSNLYIASAYTDLLKYDGLRLYKAGLPKPINIQFDSHSSVGGLDGEDDGMGGFHDISYIVVYTYTDNNGNIISSEPSEPFTYTGVTANNTIVLNIPQLEEGTGFDTDGDVKIELYRTIGGDPGTHYFVDELVNDPTTNFVTYDDVTPQTGLGFSYIIPLKPHSLPPRMKYIHVYQGLLIGAGNPSDISSVFYSDIDSPEYFPSGDNAFTIDSQVGDRTTGLSSLGNSLFIFLNESIHQVLGNLAEDTFSVDYYGNARIGCVAHHTIKEVNGFLFFLSRKGVFALDQNGQKLQEISRLIEQLFTKYDTPYNFKRATAINHLENDKYLLFMPVSQSATDLSATSESEVLAFDYVRQAWLRWDQINAMSGFTILDNELYFNELSVSDNRLAKIHNSGSTQDYCDHNLPIEFIYKSHWEDLGEPSMFKKFLRCNIISLDASLDDFESDKFDIELTTEIDWINSPSTERTLDFGGDQLGWGLDPWGLFSWGNERYDSLRTKLKPVKCKSLRVSLKNSELAENILVSVVEFEVATTYDPFIKE